MLRYILIGIGLLIAAIIGLGFSLRWDGLSALNLADRLWPGQSGHLVAAGRAYGTDLAQAIDIYAPGKTARDARLPVIIWYNGGGWASGTRQQYGFVGRALSAEGFVVAVVNYRHAPAHRFPAFIADTRDALRWVHGSIAGYGGDADRLVLMGQSAGAHMAMLTILDQRWSGAYGLRGGPVKGVVGISGPYDFLPFEPGGMADVAMGDAPNLADTQPINFARGDAPPILLLTGDADVTVRPRNSRRLLAAVASAGGSARLVEYPHVAHRDTAMAFSLPFRAMAPVLRDSVAFARRVTAQPAANAASTAANASARSAE